MAYRDDPYGPSYAAESAENETELPLLETHPPSYDDVEFPLDPTTVPRSVDVKGGSSEAHESPFRVVREPPRFERDEYRPAYSLDALGSVSSTDSRLSTDPVALNRFLLRHSEAPPELLMQVSEVHYSSSPHGAFAEGFYFAVSAGKAIEIGLGRGAKPLLYSDGSWALSLRGEPQGTRMIADEDAEEIDQLEAGRLNGTSVPGDDDEPTRGDHGGSVGIGWEGRLDGRGGRVTLVAERYDRLAMEQDRRARRGWPRFINPKSMIPILIPSSASSDPAVEHRGHPPLLFQDRLLDTADVHSARSEAYQRHAAHVREVLEHYCKNPNPARSLQVEFEVYGWDFNRLEESIAEIVKEAGCNSWKADFTLSPQTITVRPANLVTTILQSSGVQQVLLVFALIYPLVWLLDHYYGAHYNQIRIARPLTRWRVLPPPEQTSSHDFHSAVDMARTLAACPPFVQQLPSGEWVYLVGQTSDEWLKDWEVAIGNAVKQRTGSISISDMAHRLPPSSFSAGLIARGPVLLNEQDRLQEPIVVRSMIQESMDGCVVM